MSLTLRLALTYLLVALAGLLLLGGSLIALTGAATARSREQELGAQAEIFAGLVAEIAGSPDELQGLARGLTGGAAVPTGTTARIFSTGGALLSESAGLGPFPSRPVAALLDTPFPLPISEAVGRRYTARPIPSAGAPIGVVELSRSTADEQQLAADLRRVLLQATLMAVIAATLVGIVVARTLARPIVQLAAYAEQIAVESGNTAELNASPTVHRPPSNEIRRLETSLTHMAGALQQRLAEARAGREQLELVLTSVSEGILALDATGAPIFANQAAAELLGATSPKALGERLAALELPHTFDASVEQEVTLAERTLAVAIEPARFSNLRSSEPAIAAVVVLRDVTRLRELEQARTRFFRSISHDLRTPLTAMRGTLENLRDDAPAEQQPALASLESETLRLSRLVEELLNPPERGLLSIGERRRIDLGALLGELGALQQGRARRAGVSLEIVPPPPLPPVLGDRDRLKQALLNLIDNALKVTPPGGMVRLEMRGGSDQTGRATVQALVADSGPGVPAELREQIWERGTRAADYGGLGLGLAIVREIATAHGGQARVEPSQPQGAVFILELPAA